LRLLNPLSVALVGLSNLGKIGLDFEVSRNEAVSSIPLVVLYPAKAEVVHDHIGHRGIVLYRSGEFFVLRVGPNAVNLSSLAVM